jgi:hypothetical protein
MTIAHESAEYPNRSLLYRSLKAGLNNAVVTDAVILSPKGGDELIANNYTEFDDLIIVNHKMIIGPLINYQSF